MFDRNLEVVPIYLLTTLLLGAAACTPGAITPGDSSKSTGDTGETCELDCGSEDLPAETGEDPTETGEDPVPNAGPGPCVTYFDGQGDGVFEFRSEHSYDADGRQIAVEAFLDGAWSYSRGYEYAADGQLVREFEESADGPPKETLIKYDDLQREVLRQWLVDGLVVGERTTSYAGLEAVIVEPGLTQYLTFDADGRTVEWLEDWDNLVDTQHGYAYDAQGRLVDERTDYSADGVVDEQELTDWGVHGREYAALFAGVGGPEIGWQSWDYDDLGRVIERNRFADSTFETWTWTYSPTADGGWEVRKHYSHALSSLDVYAANGDLSSRTAYDHYEQVVWRYEYDYSCFTG